MAKLAFHGPHAVDGSLNDPGRHAALQQHKAAANARNKGLGRVGHQVVRADKQVFAMHAEGACALHARKLWAGFEGHARRITAQHEHDLAAGLFAWCAHRCDGAKVVICRQVADPGQSAVDQVTALHRRCLEQQGFDLREAFHWVGQARAAQRLAMHMARQPLACQRWIAASLHVQPGHGIAPHHEAGGPAHLGRFGHGGNGQAKVAGAAVGLGQVRTHRARCRQLFQHNLRVSAAIDVVCLLCQRALGNGTYGLDERLGPGSQFGGQVDEVHESSKKESGPCTGRKRWIQGRVLQSTTRPLWTLQAIEISKGIGLRMLLATGE